MILNLLANDSFTVSDFKAAGLTADNTKLESEEKYKSSQMIQENELFQDEEGNFDEQAFHQYYLGATEFYNRLADETYLEDITKNTYYSKDNIFAPEESKKIDETPKFVVSPNPFLQNTLILSIIQEKAGFLILLQTVDKGPVRLTANLGFFYVISIIR